MKAAHTSFTDRCVFEVHRLVSGTNVSYTIQLLY
jgi:hypothetical protein